LVRRTGRFPQLAHPRGSDWPWFSDTLHNVDELG
jgi:hypothetical protein